MADRRWGGIVADLIAHRPAQASTLHGHEVSPHTLFPVPYRKTLRDENHFRERPALRVKDPFGNSPARCAIVGMAGQTSASAARTSSQNSIAECSLWPSTIVSGVSGGNRQPSRIATPFSSGLYWCATKMPMGVSSLASVVYPVTRVG